MTDVTREESSELYGLGIGTDPLEEQAYSPNIRARTTAKAFITCLLTNSADIIEIDSPHGIVQYQLVKVMAVQKWVRTVCPSKAALQSAGFDTDAHQTSETIISEVISREEALNDVTRAISQTPNYSMNELNALDSSCYPGDKTAAAANAKTVIYVGDADEVTNLGSPKNAITNPRE